MSVRMASAYRAARCAAGESIGTDIFRSVARETRGARKRNQRGGYDAANSSVMKKLLPYLACLAGIVILAVLMPRFNAAQPQGIRLTRSDAVPIADATARQIGIPVDRAWSVLAWTNSTL